MHWRTSLLSIAVVSIVLIGTRIEYTELRGWSRLQVTNWDALGYYQYLPAVFIHRDITRQDGVERIDSTSHVIGTGGLYQLMPLENGKRFAGAKHHN